MFSMQLSGSVQLSTLLCAVALSCGSQPVVSNPGCTSSASCDAGIALASIAWVDPARCVAPCAHPDESALVTVSPDANPASDGAFQVAAIAQPALANLLVAAGGAGFIIQISSAYRTYDQQLALWNMLHITEPGRSARPGHSEHELGLAVDLSATADGYTWLAGHAASYGFVLSYPQGFEKFTGFRYEAWHFRYVGTQLAGELAGIPLEEFLQRNPELGTSGDCADCGDPSSNEACTDDAAGACRGTVLAWCFATKTEDSVDCAASSLSCGADSNGDGVACVP